jgi:hypothetical protein
VLRRRNLEIEARHQLVTGLWRRLVLDHPIDDYPLNPLNPVLDLDLSGRICATTRTKPPGLLIGTVSLASEGDQTFPDLFGDP